MRSADPVEHFVTLFDSHFLPMGMALHASLLSHAQPFHLWIICMDQVVEEQLRRLALPQVTLLPLAEVEDARLLQVKPERTRGEYCWTITPFTFQAVFDRDESVGRVTYLDADLFFFSDPRILLKEFDEAGKHVLITEHAYAPEYDGTFRRECGRFCVQFLTFRRGKAAQKVMSWWQDRCLEWCFDRCESGRFGDQKYLDCWPEIFAAETHIVEQVEKTLAPWNVAYFERKAAGELAPVFYHFHGLRIRSEEKIMISHYYDIGPGGLSLYDNYLNLLRSCANEMLRNGMRIPCFRDNSGFLWRSYRKLTGSDKYRRFLE